MSGNRSPVVESNCYLAWMGCLYTEHPHTLPGDAGRSMPRSASGAAGELPWTRKEQKKAFFFSFGEGESEFAWCINKYVPASTVPSRFLAGFKNAWTLTTAPPSCVLPNPPPIDPLLVSNMVAITPALLSSQETLLLPSQDSTSEHLSRTCGSQIS